MKITSNTIGRIKGHILYDAVLEYLQNIYSDVVVIEHKTQIFDEMYQKVMKYELPKELIFADPFFEDYTLFKFMKDGQERYVELIYSSCAELPRSQYDIIKQEATIVNMEWDPLGQSIEIVKDIVSTLGGGWVSDSDCITDYFYEVEAK